MGGSAIAVLNEKYNCIVTLLASSISVEGTSSLSELQELGNVESLLSTTVAVC